MSEPEGNEGSNQIYVACFVCENAIENKDGGFYSAINIFDKFEVDVPEGAEVPESLKTKAAYCVSLFRSLSKPIDFTVRWRVIFPDGKTVESPPQQMVIKEDATGHTSVFPFQLLANLAGLYLIQVLVDDRVAAFSPLLIEHVSVKPTSPDEDDRGDPDQT